jgi:hypothetical protein
MSWSIFSQLSNSRRSPSPSVSSSKISSKRFSWRGLSELKKFFLLVGMFSGGGKRGSTAILRGGGVT